ncbi:MAG TPA: CsbD family protein [Propylenella sp.]|nr:CsbD family protein [Propylenella sp.]
MSWDRVEAGWKQLKANVQRQWGRLTDDDVDSIGGRREELAARIQERYAIEKAEADRQIEDWLKEPGVLDDWNDRRAILDM